MENISGKSRASFRWMLSCVTIGIAVIVSPCLAADLGASQGMQGLGIAPPEIMPFRCDSLDPQVCFDIYWRLHNEPAPLPRSLDLWLRFFPQPPNREFAPNWSTTFKDLHYNLGTGPLSTVPSGGNNYLFR
jgi:hypothetical protein